MIQKIVCRIKKYNREKTLDESLEARKNYKYHLYGFLNNWILFYIWKMWQFFSLLGKKGKTVIYKSGQKLYMKLCKYIRRTYASIAVFSV